MTMRLKDILLAAALPLLPAPALAAPAAAYQDNRQPLTHKEYSQLPLGSIRAGGWLHEQLCRMRDGLTGHLDEIYPQVCGPRNGWLGGDGDVWERGPYWIDGLLPLAYQLGDPALIAKVRPWVEWTLASQQDDGYFGPSEDRPAESGLQRDNARDWWPKMVMLKVMQQYYMATADRRVPEFMTRYFRYQLRELPARPLGHWTFWGEQRGGDNLAVVYWLYNLTGEAFLLELAELIHRQTTPWTRYFLEGDEQARPHSLHTVNLAQGFKEPVVYYQQSRDPRQLQAVDRALRTMRHTTALPTGLWGGDEALRFGSPTAGSELCAAVEMMFSLETMLEITGDTRWADHLERVAYNALPTQATDDYMARQYFQQTNQVRATLGGREFSNPHGAADNVVFGVLTGYPCCTCNMHQGWPKLVQNLWYATAGGGLAALVYAPSTVEAQVAGGAVARITEETAYPFEESVSLTVGFAGKTRRAWFPLHLRIPAWCAKPQVRVNGEAVATDAVAGGTVRLERTWQAGDKVTLSLPMEVEVTRWYDESAVVERGPLIYALRMEEQWEKGTTRAGQAFWQATSPTPWNYCLTRALVAKTRPADAFRVEKSDHVAAYPWTLKDAPVRIHTTAQRLPGWTVAAEQAGPACYNAQFKLPGTANETITLIPYGCTTLRIAQFPVRL